MHRQLHYYKVSSATSESRIYCLFFGGGLCLRKLNARCIILKSKDMTQNKTNSIDGILILFKRTQLRHCPCKKQNIMSSIPEKYGSTKYAQWHKFNIISNMYFIFTGQNGEIIFSIISGNVGNAFVMNSISGKISSNSNLDRETRYDSLRGLV